jgi:hypothetical protein
MNWINVGCNVFAGAQEAWDRRLGLNPWHPGAKVVTFAGRSLLIPNIGNK